MMVLVRDDLTVSPFCPACGGVLPDKVVWLMNARLCRCKSRSLYVEIQPITDSRTISVAERQPWTCPRCQRVNAPHVDSCGCTP